LEGSNKLTFKQYLIIALSSVALFVALWNFETTMSVVMSLVGYLTPLFAGACIAFIINVPMRGFERFFAFLQRKLHVKARHTLNTYLSLVLTVGVLAGIVMLFINYMVPDIEASVTAIAAKVKENYPLIKDFLAEHDIKILQEAEDFINDFNAQSIMNIIKRIFGGDSTNELVGSIINAAGTTVSIVISIFSCVVFSVYMITGKKKLNVQARQLIYAYTPKKFAEKSCYVGSLFFKTFSNFISSQCLDALLLALILFGAMSVFNLPYAGLICVLTGILALIPYVGAIISCVLGAILMLLVSPVKALIFLAVFLVVQQLEGQFIYPHLVGGSVGLPAIWTLLAALVGGDMLGLFGILFFIPFTAVIYALIRDGAVRRLKEKGVVVESPLDSEDREKRREQAEKRNRRIEERRERKNAKRRKKSYYYDDDDDGTGEDDESGEE